MSLEDRLRQSLGAAGRALHSDRPAVSELEARAHRRRRRTALAAGSGAGVVVIAVAVAIFAAGSPHARDTTLGAAARATSTSSPAGHADNGGAPGGQPPTTAGVGQVTGTTSSVGASGSGSSPPASVVHPNDTTTTRPGSTTTTAPATTGDVVVTQDDAGKTFDLRVGQRLIVNLQGSGGWDYTEPASDDSAVLARLSGGADASTGDATATFRGQAVGQAHATWTKDPPCRKANPPCMPPTALFEVTVNVV